jgi:phosphomannomutase
MNKPIVSISGIRGIVGKSLHPAIIKELTEAFASYTGSKRIVIGRDGRLNGDRLEKTIESTLLLSGCEVINLGIVPTPTITLAVETLKANGGISITASHNPQEWNGMKFINRKGIFFDRYENAEFLKHVETARKSVKPKPLKQVEYYPGFIDYHINKVLSISAIDLKRIKKRKFKVVADCVNSSGSVIIPRLLQKLGCEVIKIDCDGTGIFPRNPEPVPENLKAAMAVVKKKKADVGFVVDPDSDRLAVITNEGKPFGEEYTVTTVVKHVLSRIPVRKRIVVVNLSTTRAVDDVVSALNGKLYKSPVGEINVIKKMKEVGAIVGGEGSGGVILPEVHHSRDALVGIAVILSELAEFEGKVSEYRVSLPQYCIHKTKVGLAKIKADELISSLKRKFASARLNEEDGLRIDFEDSWVNLRKSNTEPIMRIIAEAKSKKLAVELQKRVLSEIRSLL